MAFFVWKSGFCTGIEAVDVQHRAFLECLTTCQQSLATAGRTRVDETLTSRLLAYAETQFQLEETLMRSMNYTDLDSHATQHRFFERRVAELRPKNGEATTEDTLIFLRDWFLLHILEEDRCFVPYVKFTGLP